MSKATNASIQNLSIEQAAIEILALIDRTPAPPSANEIKTILKSRADAADVCDDGEVIDRLPTLKAGHINGNTP